MDRLGSFLNSLRIEILGAVLVVPVASPHLRDGSKHTGIDDFLHALMRRGEAQVVDGHDLDTRFLSRGDHYVRLLGGAGERLFDHAVFARFGGADDVFTVKLCFRGNADGIDVIAGEKLI